MQKEANVDYLSDDDEHWDKIDRPSVSILIDWPKRLIIIVLASV